MQPSISKYLDEVGRGGCAQVASSGALGEGLGALVGSLVQDWLNSGYRLVDLLSGRVPLPSPPLTPQATLLVWERFWPAGEGRSVGSGPRPPCPAAGPTLDPMVNVVDIVTGRCF